MTAVDMVNVRMAHASAHLGSLDRVVQWAPVRITAMAMVNALISDAAAWEAGLDTTATCEPAD
jgi:hypothetical protein